MQTNRSFLYGESVFTTSRVCEGQVVFLNNHLDRLTQGADFLWGPFSESEKLRLRSKIEQEISQKVNDEASRGLRITLSYQDTGRVILRHHFDFQNIHLDFLSFPLGEKKSVKLKSFRTANEQEILPSFLKNSRRVQQTITLFRQGFISEEESLLFYGPNEEVFETSWANIFAVKDNILFTPPCGGSVLSGIMREKILNYQHHKFTQVKEEFFSLSWLKTCDFVFVSNALWGVMMVESIDSTKFNRPVEEFFDFEKVILDEATRSKMSYM